MRLIYLNKELQLSESNTSSTKIYQDAIYKIRWSKNAMSIHSNSLNTSDLSHITNEEHFMKYNIIQGQWPSFRETKQGSSNTHNSYFY